MAQKRMFDRSVIDRDVFMDLPMTSKALYFLLGMEADDEGFASPKKIMRIHGGNEDDLKILIAKNFVIPFNSGVIVITDWTKNNWLKTDRIKPTMYQEERQLLDFDKFGRYYLTEGSKNVRLPRVEESSIEENSSVAKATLSFGGREKINLDEI